MAGMMAAKKVDWTAETRADWMVVKKDCLRAEMMAGMRVD